MASGGNHPSSCGRRAGWFRPQLVFLLFWLGVIPLTGRVAATTFNKQQAEVLFLTFSDPDSSDIAALIEEARTEILEGRNMPVHFTLEYIDSSFAHADQSHIRKRLSLLREKHRGQDVYLVIIIGEQAIPIIEESCRQLFLNAGLVFSTGDSDNAPLELRRMPSTTGVIRKLNYMPTLQLAMQQNPGTHHVIVISGSSDREKIEVKTARAEFHSYEPKIDFQYWTDLKFAEIQSRLANLPSGSIILFLDFNADPSGKPFVSTRILPMLAKNAARSNHGAFSSFIGTGFVGGAVADLRAVGWPPRRERARILNGEKPENIPTETGEFQRGVFDWRQLQRWHIAEDRLPPESSVLYWQPSPWEIYRWTAETVLIVVLIRNRSRRRRVEKKLRRKEEELSEAQRVAQLGSWHWDLHTNAVSWSDALYSLTGFNLSLPIQSFQQLSQFFTPGGWRQLSENMEELRRSGKACELELEGCRPDGARIWVIVRAQAVRDAKGSIAGVRGTIQDITERKRAEETRVKHSAIVESFDDAIISQDIDGIIVSWSSGAQHIFGFSEAEAVGRPISIIVPPELLYEQRSLLQRAKVGERIEHLETLRVSKERRRIHVSITMSPMRDLSGRIVGISKIARDITQDKQARQALIESERRFRLMADSAPVLMWLSGPDKLYTDFNKEWLRFTGRTMEEELAEGWKKDVHPEDLQVRLETYDRAFAALESFEAEYRMRRHDGQYRWMLDHGVPRLTEDGSFAGYIGCCIDTTEQKEAKASLRELNGRLIRAQEEERARIAGELHDDINQRLALLANGFQELEENRGARDTSPWIKQLRDLKQLAIEIAADLQHLSHRLHPSKLYYLGLPSAVRDLCKEFSKQHKIDVECTVRDLPRHLDESVSLSLFRTAQESLHNAAKHSRARHIKVELAGESGMVRLRVADDGIGFDPEQVGNSGLGLFSMRERLRLAGGEFSIRSRPFRGTQVEGTVPATTRHAQIA
ncbi:MAG TPA: PAS domain S-box protein [Terriglobales bacterium]|jgi:PAS domain S-box-containing protein|nr:PAS domain S-box protein [Terriglobales bacterium]